MRLHAPIRSFNFRFMLFCFEQGSGSNVDLCVITKDGVDYIRPHDEANKKGVRQRSYKYPNGATEVLTTTVVKFNVEEEEAMETS